MNYRRQSGTFKFEEDTFSNNAEGIKNFYQKVIVLLKFLQTKPGIKG